MTERQGAAHRIVATKKHDYSGQHQITNAPGSREQHEAFHRPHPFGPLEPVSDEEYTSRRNEFKRRGWS